jgi:hypothetical protein
MVVRILSIAKGLNLLRAEPVAEHIGGAMTIDNLIPEHVRHDLPLTQLGLDISPTVQAQSWQQGQAALTPLGHWQLYFNQMVLETFLPWLQAEYEAHAKVWPQESVSIASLALLFQMVNGTGIVLDPGGATEKRLVLIPDASIEFSEFRVPQEWVDIPSWAGDYYLAITVTPEGDFLRVYGYVTHELIRQKGTYDPDDRTYCLSTIDLIDDLNALWVIRDLNPQEATQAVITPIFSMPDAVLPSFLSSLKDCVNRNPRLDLPLPQWSAFLERSDRLMQLDSILKSSPTPMIPAIAESIVNLGQWIENIFEQTWQTIESVMGAEPELGVTFRKSSINPDKKTRRIKMIHLQSETVDERVLLMVNLVIEADERLGVQVCLLPSDRTKFLPTGLQLMMMSNSGAVVQSVQSQQQDRYIQLKLFRCSRGTRFRLVMAIDRANVVEQFIC